MNYSTVSSGAEEITLEITAFIQQAKDYNGFYTTCTCEAQHNSLPEGQWRPYSTNYSANKDQIGTKVKVEVVGSKYPGFATLWNCSCVFGYELCKKKQGPAEDSPTWKQQRGLME